MEHQLKLTARGQAVYELMADLGLSLDAACARVELELETLRQTVDNILTESAWEDVPNAMQAALRGVSLQLQNAYLEESERDNDDAAPHRAPWQDGVGVH